MQGRTARTPTRLSWSATPALSPHQSDPTGIRRSPDRYRLGPRPATTRPSTVDGISTTWDGTVQFSLRRPDRMRLLRTTQRHRQSCRGEQQQRPWTVPSDAATVTAAGDYCWSARFTSDDRRGPGRPATTVTNECFTVTPVTPTLDTEAVASPVVFGNPVQDNATLTETATQPGDPVINPTNRRCSGRRKHHLHPVRTERLHHGSPRRPGRLTHSRCPSAATVPLTIPTAR